MVGWKWGQGLVDNGGPRCYIGDYRGIICVYMGMSCGFMLLVNMIFCKLVISVLRSLTIS